MDHEARFTADKIARRLALIAPLVVQDRQPMAPLSLEVLPDARAEPGQGHDQGPVAWNTYWAGQDTHFVLRGAVSVPPGWDCPALDLPLGVAGDIFTHPEALVRVAGRILGSADRYHHHIGVPLDLGPGPHDVMLQGWTGLAGWPPDPADPTRLQLRQCWVVNLDPALRDFCAQAQVALECAQHVSPDRPERARLLTALDRAFVTLDTRDPLGDALRATVPAAQEVLRAGLAEAGVPLDVTLHAIGHAHMDIAYLWPIEQIRRKNAHTYSNVLRLMAAHDDYVFSHSQPQLYDYTAIDTPELFDDIRTRVREGRWEIMGGMWVEPDVNMPGSESLVRQILLGRQYFTETFGAGVETPVLWLPDTFGFPACLPQLMAQAGLRWFVTNKLNWNQINRMPASTFWWDGIDGSRVMAHVLTTPREVQHLPFPTNYKSDLTAPEVLGTWAHATARDATRSLPICYGYGDGGGGPTDDLIRRARAWAEMPGAPRVEMATVRTALEALEATAGDAPVWAGELYMEGHRGTLTSQGWIKQANRLAEATLSEVETLVVMRWPGGAPADVRAELTRLWRVLCLNQFHDILTGTAVEQVFDDARADFATIMSGCASLRSRCHSVMAGACAANLSPLPSSELVTLKPGLPLAGTKGPCPEQSIEGGRLVAVPRREGRSVLPLTHSAQAGQVSAPVTTGQDADGLWMRNAHVMVRLTAQGAITAITDLRHDRQVLAPGTIGNQLTAFEDRPISWDAWDIDPFFEDRPTDLHPTSATWTETGPLRATLRVVTQWGRSTITQDIRLMHHSARVQFDTEVDWHAQHILLKTAFATQIHSPRATYDIQWGQVERPTHRNTPRDAAQFEVAAQRWVDLSEPDYGVALLNTGKYGHDVRGGVMRLSLLKSATSPDPTADQGRHSFGYALLPHAADRPQVQAEARAMIHPTRVSGLDYGGAPLAPEVAPLVHVNRDHVILETVKPAEDGRGFILRLYEAEGRRGTIEITFGLPIEHVSQVDLLEQDGSALKVARTLDGAPDAASGRAKVTLSVTPFQIVTLRCCLSPAT